MSIVKTEDKGKMGTLMTVTLEPLDYEPKFKEELNRLKKTVQLKGFRKGKTPVSIIKKMYGKEVLQDIISKMLSDEMSKYIETEGLSIIADPIIAEGETTPEITPAHTGDYVYRFEVGLAPEFELKGLSGDEDIEWHDVIVSDEIVDEEIDRLYKFTSDRISVDDDIRENDDIKLEVRELEGESIKEDGVSATFSVLYDNLSEEAKKELKGKTKGETLKMNIFRLEEKTNEKYVRKYLLELPEEDDREVNELFAMQIKDVMRLDIEDELTQEHFDKYFGVDQVHSEEEARELIKKDLKEHFDAESDGIFFDTALEYIFEVNELELPEDFLRKWFDQYRQPAEGLTPDEAFEKFLEATRKRLVIQKIEKEYNLRITREDIINEIKDELRKYMNNMGSQLDDATMDRAAERLLKQQQNNEEIISEYTDRIMNKKIFAVIKENTGRKPVEISYDEFTKIVDAFNQKHQKQETPQVEPAALEEE